LNLVYPSNDLSLFQKVLPKLNFKPCNFNLSTQKLHNKILYLALGSKLFCKSKLGNKISKKSINQIFSLEDNNIHLWQIEKSFPNTKVFLFQNGWRDSTFFNKFERHKSIYCQVTRYFAQGNSFHNYFKNNGTSKVVTSGNIKNNHFDSSFKKERSILFISQYFPTNEIKLGIKRIENQNFFFNIDQPIIKICEEFAHRNNAKLFILGRPSNISKFREQEANYYRNILRSAKIKSRNNEHFCYEEIRKHNLVVTVDSNLGYEAGAKGIKVCFFPLRSSLLNLSDRKFGFPKPFPEIGFCWSNKYDRAKILEIIHKNFYSSRKAFCANINQIGFDNVMIFNPNNTIIKEELCKIKQQKNR